MKIPLKAAIRVTVAAADGSSYDMTIANTTGWSLDEAVAAINKFLTDTIPGETDLAETALRLAKAHTPLKKIQAIKDFRAETGLSLKESKTWIENAMEEFFGYHTPGRYNLRHPEHSPVAMIDEE